MSHDRDQRVANDALQKFAVVKAGQVAKHMQRPFADPKFLNLQTYLETYGLGKKKYPEFHKRLEAYLKMTEQTSISKAKEQNKFNLLISDKLRKAATIDERKSLYEL